MKVINCGPVTKINKSINNKNFSNLYLLNILIYKRIDFLYEKKKY